MRPCRFIPMLLALLCAATLISCSTGRRTLSKTTDTQSSTFSSDADKIAFVEHYCTLASPLITTEFHIVYHDNESGRVPGPSDWDMQVLMLVRPQDAPRWTNGMLHVPAQHIDLAWGYVLLPPDPRWMITSQPVVYERSGVIVAVFEREGIIFKRVWTT
ncbi:MAG: hypothetical protein H0X37_12335 [Herpetosiphonaceae bacterium]|nr:hypothetical protein [Herpetosiphonaceae bacterium]